MNNEEKNRELLEEEMTNEENQEISSNLSKYSFQSTSSYNADMNLELIVSYFNKDKFVLDPEFQRRNVWNAIQQSRFIESIVLTSLFLLF